MGAGLGLLYANAFEYFFHRFALHPPGRTLAHYHGLHHSTWGTLDEPLYVNFAKNPLIVVLLIAVNGLPVFALEYVLRAGLAPGIMVGFVYFVAYEEIHCAYTLTTGFPLGSILRGAIICGITPQRVSTSTSFSLSSIGSSARRVPRRTRDDGVSDPAFTLGVTTIWQELWARCSAAEILATIFFLKRL
jgi:Fatty acid hydroxylase superfamily